jgi:O-antigen ligase
VSERVWGWIAAAFAVACVLLGGASAAGAVANGVLQAIAIVLIVLMAWSPRSGASPAAGTPTLVLIVGAYLLWGLLQLIPLPAGLWESLPGRAPVASALRSIGVEPGAMPISLTPRRTVESLLWLLPPTAAFFLVLRLPSRERRRVAMAILAAALASIVLGAFQVMGGEGSRLRFYAITNPSSPVGFFANKNHLATLLLCALPLAAALGGRSAGAQGQRTRRHSGRMIYASIAAFILIGVAINGSMAGYALLIPVSFAAVLIYRREVNRQTPKGAVYILGALIAAFVAFAAFGPISSEKLADKFTTDPASRQVLTPRTLQAAGDHFPVGSGLGSFQQVYRTYEDPADATRQFANHAHDDYAEIALELGLPGLVLVLLFLLWWGRRSLAAWPGDFSAASLARAGSVIVGVVLFHSLVDYPIRTSAIAALFAAACALLIQPPIPAAVVRSAEEEREGGARHLSAE